MYIVIDFDGTCVSHNFPEIGKDIGAAPVLKKLVEKGHKLILFTMRCDNSPEKTFPNNYKIHSGDFLSQAVRWFEENNVPLYGIQKKPTQEEWTTSPKAYGSMIIDDVALGCPLKYDPEISSREFVDWNVVEKMLQNKGLI